MRKELYDIVNIVRNIPGHINSRPTPDCRCVMFCNWGHYNRDCTPETYDLATKEFEKMFNLPFDADAKLGGEWHTSIRSRILSTMDFEAVV